MFGQVIKDLRKSKQLTQQQLAIVLQVDTSTIGKWEGKGNVVPAAEILINVASYFNVTTDYLLGKEKVATLSDDDLNAEFFKLIPQLDEAEQNILLSQIKGILRAKEE